MTTERWQEVKQLITSKFQVESTSEEDLEPGQAEVIIFRGPLGRLQAKFITRPKMLGKKTGYSNRIGGDVNVQYVFSDNEFVSHLELSKWDEAANDWQELDADKLF